MFFGIMCLLAPFLCLRVHVQSINVSPSLLLSLSIRVVSNHSYIFHFWLFVRNKNGEKTFNVFTIQYTYFPSSLLCKFGTVEI